MSTLTREPKSTRTNRTLLHSNPILSRLSKVDERTETNAASYVGIAAKTSFFLLVTLIGMVAQLIVMGLMAGEPVWQTIQVYEKFTVSLRLHLLL